MKKHDRPFGHVIFDHEYNVEQGSISSEYIVMTAYLSKFPWLEIYLEFKLDTPRRTVRRALVEELKNKIGLMRDFMCSDCEFNRQEEPVNPMFKELMDMTNSTSSDFVSVNFVDLQPENKMLQEMGKESDDIEFRPLFSFTETNREIIKPLFKKWFKERKDN